MSRLMRSMLKITPELERILLVRATKSTLDQAMRRSWASHTQSRCCGFSFYLSWLKECVGLCVSILEMWSEAIKILKGEYTVRAIKEHKMDQAIIFCRTKIDCDNMEQYFIQQGGGGRSRRLKLPKISKRPKDELILLHNPSIVSRSWQQKPPVFLRLSPWWS